MDSFKSYLFRQAYKEVERLGDRLAEAEPLIDWEAFRPTLAGFYMNGKYLTPSGGYSAIMGGVTTHCHLPKYVLMCQVDKLDEVLKEIVNQKQFPQTLTISLDDTEKEMTKNPVNPNRFLVAFTSKKRKESKWLTLGKENREKFGKHALSVLSDEDVEEIS